MNLARRKILNEAGMKLREMQRLLSSALDGEQDALYNIPENLQSSDRYQDMEEAVDNLESAIDMLDEVDEYIRLAAG